MINLLLTMFLACGDKETEDTAAEEVVEDTAAELEDTGAELPEDETEEGSEESEEPAE